MSEQGKNLNLLDNNEHLKKNIRFLAQGGGVEEWLKITFSIIKQVKEQIQIILKLYEDSGEEIGTITFTSTTNNQEKIMRTMIENSLSVNIQKFVSVYGFNKMIISLIGEDIDGGTHTKTTTYKILENLTLKEENGEFYISGKT